MTLYAILALLLLCRLLVDLISVPLHLCTFSNVLNDIIAIGVVSIATELHYIANILKERKNQ